MSTRYKRKPDWLKIRLPLGSNYVQLSRLMHQQGLHTICESGKCPNLGDCWGRGTATFLILGNICTRSCKFCGVQTGKPQLPDPLEPEKIAQAVETMGIRHCVLTSVDRDDLPDKGAGHWAKTITTLKNRLPAVTIEALIPDFDGIESLIAQVAACGPDVISHNLETVRRITPLVRTRANYDTSLKVLRCISQNGVTAKTGIMLGLGETEAEILQTMDEALDAGCTVFTIGQYLQPSAENLAVEEYLPPIFFEKLRQAGFEKGFRHVESSPLVRSSYHAEKHLT